MLFNSADFIVFFIIVLLLYYILPHRVRWVMLLGASLIFYMAWEPSLVVLILFSSFSNYALSLAIYGKKDKLIRKRLLIISMIINFGLLFIFKYLVFINNSLMWVFNFANLHYPINEFDIILPMGISFYTFQAAAYTIDVYRGDIKPQKNYLKFTLFITFFPQLVAGPIERAKNLMGRIFKYHPFKWDNIVLGAKIMLIGYFKKVVIADRVCTVVNTVFENPTNFGGFSFIVGAILFSIQIFCDFSGYSDIAIGCARMFGIELMTNFDRPYFSRSIREFWRRWHISLSTWFKDYLYIPLGGSRVSEGRWIFNIMTTFTVSGLWHGANMTFIIWGALHGIYQVIGKFKRKFIPEFGGFIFKVAGIVVTYGLVVFAWIFFRANTVGDAFYIVSHLTSDLFRITDKAYVYETVLSWGLGLFPLAIVILAIIILFIMELVSYKESIVKILDKKPFIVRFAFYALLAIFLIGAGRYDNGSAFIYFQF